eukprot:TRINITY_DN16573_c0_g1_i1.p2 TRINITY_DN16573_c0_g1~~TRINITY_DN16573_c0_g1_i1.p2  ORF type:complete len:361 (+),score=120.21 TRINITY_DN16573_c0_g1_i1:51-1085(+)
MPLDVVSAAAATSPRPYVAGPALSGRAAGFDAGQLNREVEALVAGAPARPAEAVVASVEARVNNLLRLRGGLASGEAKAAVANNVLALLAMSESFALYQHTEVKAMQALLDGFPAAGEVLAMVTSYGGPAGAAGAAGVGAPPPADPHGALIPNRAWTVADRAARGSALPLATYIAEYNRAVRGVGADPDASVGGFRRALALAKQHGWGSGAAHALDGLAAAYLAANDVAAAEDAVRERTAMPAHLARWRCVIPALAPPGSGLCSAAYPVALPTQGVFTLAGKPSNGLRARGSGSGRSLPLLCCVIMFEDAAPPPDLRPRPPSGGAPQLALGHRAADASHPLEDP